MRHRFRGGGKSKRPGANRPRATTRAEIPKTPHSEDTSRTAIGQHIDQSSTAPPASIVATITPQVGFISTEPGEGVGPAIVWSYLNGPSAPSDCHDVGSVLADHFRKLEAEAGDGRA